MTLKADKTELGLTSNLDMKNHNINNVKKATSGHQAINFAQLNNELGNYLHETGGTMKGDIQMNNNSIYGIKNSRDKTSAVNREYVNDELKKKLDKNKDINMGGNKIVSYRNQNDLNELVNKSYVDQKVSQASSNIDLSNYLKNIRLFNEARFSLKEAYRDEQKSYLESKISQIRNSATNKRSAEAWKTVNEITGRKSSNSSKLKAASQEERIQLWKNHLKDLLGKPPQVSNELITPIVEEELNIKKGDFSMDELVKALKSTQNHKAYGLDEIPAEVWKLPDFHQILLNLCNSVYNGDSIDRWTEGCILPFPKKGDLSIAKNYRGITLTAISAKIYNLLLLNRIRPEVDSILRKNQNGFRSNRSTSGQILTIRRILEGVHAKTLPATLLFIDFSKAYTVEE